MSLKNKKIVIAFKISVWLKPSCSYKTKNIILVLPIIYCAISIKQIVNCSV